MKSMGIRSIPPCGDCDEDGTCNMNCGPVLERELHENVKLDGAGKRNQKGSIRDLQSVMD